MRQSVINYECDVFQKQATQTQAYARVLDPHNYRYSAWKLHQTIQNFVNTPNYTIKWIGCDPNAHVLSFFYCMLVGCLHSSQQADDLFIKLKYCLYQESKETLSISEQKIFIQHLALVQDSKNIGEFLKRSNHLENIFLKLFSARHSQNVNSTLSTTTIENHQKIPELQSYSNIFPFINLQILNQKCGKMIIGENIFLIMEEKQCYFIIQQVCNKSRSIPPSNTSNHRKINIEVSPSTQIIQSMKTQQMIDSKQSKKGSESKFFTLSPTIQNCDYKISEKGSPQKTKKQKNSTSTPIDGLNSLQDLQKQQFIEENQNKFDYFRRENPVQLYSKEIKSEKFLQNYLKTDHGDIRHPNLNQKSERSFHFSPSNQKTNFIKSKQKSKQKSKSKTKFQEGKVHFKNFQVQEKVKISHLNIRKDYIYQSLNPKQIVQTIQEYKKQDIITPKFPKRVPKFLSKKNQQIVPVTFSNSPAKANESPKHYFNKFRNTMKNEKLQQSISKTFSHKNLSNLNFTEANIQKKPFMAQSKKNYPQMHHYTDKKFSNF